MTDENWMRSALAALIDHVDDTTAREALADDAAFDGLRARLEADPVPDMPAGDRGDNLLRALLALRVKFSPDEARAKLETNLAMRRPSRRPLGDGL